MSAIFVKQYFEERCKEQRLKQISDTFFQNDVPQPKAESFFHVFIESVSGIERQNQAYNLESRVIVKIFEPSRINVNKSYENLIKRCESLFISCLNNSAIAGLIAVTLERISYDALDVAKNDNFLIGEIEFRAKHIVCLEIEEENEEN